MVLKTVKSPHECGNKEEIRDEIDRIDHEIIDLFALRFEYVKAIVKFKTDKESVVAQERKDRVIIQRALWAKEAGLDESAFRQIFQTLIDSNIKKELDILENNRG